MLKIRLQRTGRINDPSYRVVVTEHTNGPKSGKPVEKLGSYNPKTKERILNEERILYWLSKGAQASGTMYNMLISAGILKGKKKINVLPQKSPVKKEGEAEAAAPAAAAPAAAEAPATPAEEAPVAEEKKEEAPAETPAA